MSKPIVYLSGPMRGNQFYNFPAFDRWKKIFSDLGCDVISPADTDREVFHFDGMKCDPEDKCLGVPEYVDCVTGELRKFDLERCIRTDVDSVLRCTHVVLIGDPSQSPGTRAEIAVANWAGKKVGCVEDLRFVSYTREWLGLPQETRDE